MMPRSSVFPKSPRWLLNAPLNKLEPMAFPSTRPLSLGTRSRLRRGRARNPAATVEFERPRAGVNACFELELTSKAGPMELMPSTASNRLPLASTGAA